MNPTPRLLIIGAHPDDAEFSGGGLATIYRQLGRCVKMISVTDGSAGHHFRQPSDLVETRRAEAAAAGDIIGAKYETWDFPDARLEPTLEVRWKIIQEIRTYKPDLVLTHRTCDYHPDHRAVGQAVQDASYLVTVPHVVPTVPALRKDPVVAYLPDHFTRPNPLRPDVILDISDQVSTIARMLACHRTQLFEWLAYEADILDTVPDDESAKLSWVQSWIMRHIAYRVERHHDELVKRFGEYQAGNLKAIEMFEISEYAGKADAAKIAELFPGGRSLI